MEPGPFSPHESAVRRRGASTPLTEMICVESGVYRVHRRREQINGIRATWKMSRRGFLCLRAHTRGVARQLEPFSFSVTAIGGSYM